MEFHQLKPQKFYHPHFVPVSFRIPAIRLSVFIGQEPFKHDELCWSVEIVLGRFILVDRKLSWGIYRNKSNRLQFHRER